VCVCARACVRVCACPCICASVQALSEENKQLRKRLVAAGLGDAGEADDPLEDMLGMGGCAGGSGGGPRGLLGKGHEASRQRDMIAKAANKMILKVTFLSFHLCGEFFLSFFFVLTFDL